MWSNKRPLCAITMVRDDLFFLRKWITHYSSQVGIENLYVILHGSNSMARDLLGRLNVISVPIRGKGDTVRFKQFNEERFYLINNLANSLLSYYQWVIVTDVDEYIVVDPCISPSLNSYFSETDPVNDVISTIGLNVVHRTHCENPVFDFHKPILSQRYHAVFAPLYCKPAISRIPIQRSLGNHASDHNILHIDHNLYLFHMKWMDKSFSMKHYYYRYLARENIYYEPDLYPIYKGEQFPLVSHLESVFNKYDAQPVNKNFDFSKDIQNLHRTWRRRRYFFQKEYWKTVFSKSWIPYSRHYRFDLDCDEGVHSIPARFHQIV